eukprot:GILK01017343.1.p1 GENE.GILK01017343.1~~GILK01017343.1.p1  ORF type:complete len:109 (-),score=19.84 GILK01017343.1:14-307(-)
MEESRYNSKDDVEMVVPQAPGPRKPVPGYMIFFREKSSQLNKEDPDLSVVQRFKMWSDAWKALPAEEKERYVAMAATENARYEQQMAIDKGSHPNEA